MAEDEILNYLIYKVLEEVDCTGVEGEDTYRLVSLATYKVLGKVFHDS